jgi:hypothetical protein
MSTSSFQAALKYRRIKFLLGDRSAFGCGWHRFRCARRCSLPDLDRFESRWGISLPSEFRSVLSEVGNGCGGPYYGLSPLESWSQPWEPTELDPATLSRPFDPAGPPERGLYRGSMRICNAGCEHYILLVIAGRFAGEIWRDFEGGPPSPVLDSSGRTESFASWIAKWVNEGSAGPDDPFWTSLDSDNHAVAKVINSAASQLTTVAVDQLPCPACVKRLAQLRPLPRVVVPTPSSAPEGFTNPKSAAILAAQHHTSIVPRQIIPASKPLLG